MSFRQYRLHAYGNAGLKLETAEERMPGAGEVLLRIHAVALNNRDLGILNGQYGPRIRLPLVPCSDACGTIAALGAGVEGLEVGTRVITSFFPRWASGRPAAGTLDVSLGCEIDGVLAELAIVPAAAIVPAPAYLSDDEAACLPCAGVTAWSALFVETQTRPGSRVLIQGTGGVAVFALQLASAAGAEAIVLSSSDAKLARARSLGAIHLINYRANPEWGERVRELTNGEGVDTVIELGGPATLPRSVEALALGGTVCVIGLLSGVRAELGVLDMLYRRARIVGITVGSRHDQVQLCTALRQRQIHPVVDRSFEFEEAPEALACMASGSHFGKLVVHTTRAAGDAANPPA